MTDDVPRPGSAGEHALQLQHGTADRADAFYRNQVLDRLNERMVAFVGRMTMVFVATADGHGECDCSIRCGLPGFVYVLDDGRTLAYPEYRGNGVMASLGNLSENGHVGLLFVDFVQDCVGLHVNGRGAVVETDALLARPGLPEQLWDDCQLRGGRRPERWVVVSVDEAYIHCAKHLPMMAVVPKKIRWGTDDPVAKGGDYFGIAASRAGGE
jgi:predicted pyridoxine 5'-phosphate oxidase superfamily flavin-nucleotide-binding protein